MTYQSRSFNETLSAKEGSMCVLLCWPLLLLLALGLSACERNGASIAEPQYATELVGDWQGTVGGESESISFRADGSFTSQLLQTGFISSTLGQGVAGSISGTWALQGKALTLTIDSAEHERPVNRVTTSTIVSFKQNELVVNSATGGTSTFVRAIDL
jgi:hypothetical protein